MPLSKTAYQGLRAVAEWNPHGAKMLYSILKETPDWVKYKDDPYGPLGLILFGVANRTDLGKGVSIPVKQPPFPDEYLETCTVFGDEWKQRLFTKSELADALGQILNLTDENGA
jgi:hypothetical protein